MTPAAAYQTHPPLVAGAAVSSLAFAHRHEPEITEAILEALPGDARPHGLEYRMKSLSSLARKIANRSLLTSAEDPYEIADELTDILRYTGVAPTSEQLVPMATATLTALRRRGWTIVEIENSYVDDNPYKGLHSLVSDPSSGMTIEVQFHSEASQTVKDQHHIDYELARDRTQPAAARRAADERTRSARATVPSPPGLGALTAIAGCPVQTKTYRRTTPRQEGAQP